MKNTWFIALLMLIAVLGVKTSNAQDSTFKLSDYKNPDYLYQSLDLNFGLNSALSVNNFTTSEVDSKLNSSSFSLNSQVGGAYSYFKNSAKTQTEKHILLDAGIGSSSGSSSRELGNFDFKSVHFSHYENLHINGLKRLYNEKKRYFEVNGAVSAFYTGYSIHSEGLNSGTIGFEEEYGQKT